MPRRGRNLTLSLLSYVFYGWANPWFVYLMLGSTLVDFVCGLAMSGQLGHGRDADVPLLEPGGDRSRVQKAAVTISIITNLSLLGVFKYFNFGVEAYNSLFASLGFEEYQYRNFVRLTLPLGISFYTFQSMSYSIDVYRGHARAVRNFIDFACYVSMFPQLVAGPIVRFHEVAYQLQSRTCTLEKFGRGVTFFCLGMAKKVIIADGCGKVADTVFNAAGVGVVDAWYGLVAYAFQIYFDFSAYTDMAIGLGLMLGFVFPKNFDSPYRSASITEFWRRWHLSLSHWLRDYLYVPLGGNRKGTARTFANLLTVMVLGGLWHGAAWSFIIWGAIHGTLLAYERLLGKQSVYQRLPHLLRVAVTFLMLLITWVFFRADNLQAAMDYLGFMFGLGEVAQGAALIDGIIYQPFYLLIVVLAGLITWGAPQTWDWTRRMSWPKVATCLILLVASLLLLISGSYSPFIYFIF